MSVSIELNAAKETGISPRYTTLLLDMDGVLAEVSNSYRAAIRATCHAFGAKSVSYETITEWKARGNANDDWKLSYDLIHSDPDGDKSATLEQVTEKFEQTYQGHGDVPGLYTVETLIPLRETLLELKKRSQGGIGIVTGRPRHDYDQFVKQHNLEDLIAASHCAEDGPKKPDPFPVLNACKLLGVKPSRSVVLVGDTPDDVDAATSAGCSAVGVITPEAATVQDAKGESYEQSTLCEAMKQRGADMIVAPGFAELVNHFFTEN